MQDTVTDHRHRTAGGPTARQQSVISLRKATAVRLARSAQKQRLASASSARAARRIAADCLVELPPELRTIHVEEFLLACRGVGERVLGELLEAAGLDGSERLGDGTPTYGALTPRQLRVLTGVLLSDTALPGTRTVDSAQAA